LKEALETSPEAETISIVTGPEGGFDPEEAAFAAGNGMISVSLGPRILRCETAPIAALSAIMYHTGNL
jgi:16S rRNA (uracil1498-N3)-methyltransferase